MSLPTAQAILPRSSRLRLLRMRETTQQSNRQRPSTATTPSTSFSDLPTELIVQVFCSVDRFSTATALSSVSHQLLSIWKYFLPSISRTLLSSAIECFDQAEILVEAQSLVVQDQNSPDAKEVAIGRAKLLFANAEIACLALHRYECTLFDRKKLNGTDMTADERTSFMKAWYRAIAMALLGNDFAPLPYQILVSMDLLQFLQMVEATMWLAYFQSEHEKLSPYITLIHRQKIDLTMLKEYLCRGRFGGQGCQTSMTHFHTYILHDHSSQDIYSGMEVGLGQLFQQFPAYMLEGILADFH